MSCHVMSCDAVRVHHEREGKRRHTRKVGRKEERV